MQKPRDLSRKFGLQSLQTEHLLALILRYGTRKQSVYNMSKNVALVFNECISGAVSSESFISRIAVGFPKNAVALSVLGAAYELSLRNHESAYPPILAKPENIAAQFKWLAEKKQENLYGVYLNSRLQVVKSKLLAKGSTDMVNFEARDALYYAIKFRTRHFIIVHNHPSGDATPSVEDTTITKKVAGIARDLQMELVDHVIVASKGYYSFRQQQVVL